MKVSATVVIRQRSEVWFLIAWDEASPKFEEGDRTLFRVTTWKDNGNEATKDVLAYAQQKLFQKRGRLIRKLSVFSPTVH